jgi:hypothetical protein
VQQEQACVSRPTDSRRIRRAQTTQDWIGMSGACGIHAVGADRGGFGHASILLSGGRCCQAPSGPAIVAAVIIISII